MVGLSSNAPVGVSIASNNNPTQVRWKDLRFLMKCPSKEHVELICEEVFHRRHESIMPSSFVQTHAAVLRLDTSRLDHLYQVLRALFAEIFLVLPNPFTQVIAEDYLRNKVAKLDPRLIELLASVGLVYQLLSHN
jgi:galactose-1-phosphate uridylyltransferase